MRNCVPGNLKLLPRRALEEHRLEVQLRDVYCGRAERRAVEWKRDNAEMCLTECWSFTN